MILENYILKRSGSVSLVTLPKINKTNINIIIIIIIVFNSKLDIDASQWTKSNKTNRWQNKDVWKTAKI